MKKFIVTTTINEPTKATLKFCNIAKEKDWTFVIVGDTKTPHHLYNELQKRNFFNVENQYSILKWSTKNKLVCKTTHLSDDGQVIFSELIDKKLKEYKNISKYINTDNVLSEEEIKKFFMKKLL
jgi:hypothetical protein